MALIHVRSDPRLKIIHCPILIIFSTVILQGVKGTRKYVVYSVDQRDPHTFAIDRTLS